jgi:hypothetical protein
MIKCFKFSIFYKQKEFMVIYNQLFLIQLKMNRNKPILYISQIVCQHIYKKFNI